MKVTARSAEELGQAVRRFRKAKKLSQSEVAKPFNLRQATISNLELGIDNQTLDFLFRVLSSLNLEIVVQEKKSLPEVDKDNW